MGTRVSLDGMDHRRRAAPMVGTGPMRCGVLLAVVVAVSACASSAPARSGSAHPRHRRGIQAISAPCRIRPDRPLRFGVSGPGSPDLPHFEVVTRRTGLEYCQGDRRVAPRCYLNSASMRKRFPDFKGPAAIFDGGEACESERQTGGVAIGDYDADGRPDVYVTRLDAPGLLFRNAGNGTFTDVTAAIGLSGVDVPSNGAGWADIDNDGHLDLFVTTIAAPHLLLFHNEGGRLVEQGISRGVGGDPTSPKVLQSVNFGDFDRDGFVDVHTTEWRKFDVGANRLTASRLYRNLGATKPGFFEDVTDSQGVNLAQPTAPDWSFASAFADLDQDGRQDLYVASDFGTSRLFWNDGARFSDGTKTAAVGSEEDAMGLTIADYDGDGRPDVFVSGIFDPLARCSTGNCNNGRSGNRLYRNLGGRRFEDVTDRAGVRDGAWGWGSAFLDATNAGRQDLVQVSGMELPYVATGQWRAGQSYFWANAGDGSFVEAARSVGISMPGPSKGLAVFDYDQDGRLDLFVVRDGQGPVVYHNVTEASGHWLGVHLVGTTSTRDGWGATVDVRTADGRVQRSEYGSVTHYAGQSELTTHVGLGAQATVEEVRIGWPSGKTSIVHPGAAVDRVVTITEGS